MSPTAPLTTSRVQHLTEIILHKWNVDSLRTIFCTEILSRTDDESFEDADFLQALVGLAGVVPRFHDLSHVREMLEGRVTARLKKGTTYSWPGVCIDDLKAAKRLYEGRLNRKFETKSIFDGEEEMEQQEVNDERQRVNLGLMGRGNSRGGRDRPRRSESTSQPTQGNGRTEGQRPMPDQGESSIANSRVTKRLEETMDGSGGRKAFRIHNSPSLQQRPILPPTGQARSQQPVPEPQEPSSVPPTSHPSPSSQTRPPAADSAHPSRPPQPSQTAKSPRPAPQSEPPINCAPPLQGTQERAEHCLWECIDEMEDCFVDPLGSTHEQHIALRNSKEQLYRAKEEYYEALRRRMLARYMVRITRHERLLDEIEKSIEGRNRAKALSRRNAARSRRRNNA